MKNNNIKFLTYPLFSIVFLIITGCPGSRPAVEDKCENVPKLRWQIEDREFNNETALQLVTDLQAAAELDAKVIKKGEASGSVKSELAITINKNINQSSSVSEEFWEQELTYRQTLCFYDYMTRRPDLSQEVKNKYHEAILELTRLRTQYTFASKQRKEKGR